MPPTLDAVLLPGWMERNEAITFLQKMCWFDPPLTDEQAEALWAPYRDRVQGLPPRNIQPPVRLPIAPADQHHVSDFLAKKRGPEVLDVINVNPMELVICQSFVITDVANEHALNSGRWTETFLVINRPNVQLPSRIENEVLKFTLPHAEHMCEIKNGQFLIKQGAGYVAVVELEGRLVLKTGYHRCFAFARAVRNTPEAGDPSVVMALAANLPAHLLPNLPESQRLRTILLGPRPPLFSDFFEPDLTLAVRVRKKRYEIHIGMRTIDEP
jgi:hypothetical protein